MGTLEAVSEFQAGATGGRQYGRGRGMVVGVGGYGWVWRCWVGLGAEMGRAKPSAGPRGGARGHRRERGLWAEWGLSGQGWGQSCRGRTSLAEWGWVWGLVLFPRTASSKQAQRPEAGPAPRPTPLLWAFTLRLPTMRRCFRKFLGKKAPGAAGGWRGGGQWPLASPPPDSPRPCPPFFSERCSPGAPDLVHWPRPTQKQIPPSPLLLRLGGAHPFAAWTKAQ